MPVKSLLFLGKKHDPHTDAALAFCRRNVPDVTACLGTWDTPLPDEVGFWRGDVIVSYLSRWVVPDALLRRAAVAAINFHPATPHYPGIGCVNFALYDGAREYGVTCHHMAPRVDTGAIIAVKRFPILETDNVATLLARAYHYQLALFYDIAGAIMAGEPIPVSGERWAREALTRKAFNRLGQITPDMDHTEVARRVRATSFGEWGPTMTLHGFTFKLETPTREQ